jgi:hypothetical protein
MFQLGGVSPVKDLDVVLNDLIDLTSDRWYGMRELKGERREEIS